MTDAILSLSHVSAAYGPVRALTDISLEVAEGEIVCLLGSNAAGKSTTLRTILGMTRASGGEIIFDGERIESLTTPEIVSRGLTMVPENRRLFGKMSVRENLEIGGNLREDKDEIQKDIERVFSLFPRLKERIKQRAGTLSGGEQQMLAIGRALMTRPRLLMLDEPSQGIMPKLVDEIFDAVVAIRDAGVTVLLVEQRLAESLQIAERAYVLQTGRVILSGTAAEVRDNPEVRRAYLGI